MAQLYKLSKYTKSKIMSPVLSNTTMHTVAANGAIVLSVNTNEMQKEPAKKMDTNKNWYQQYSESAKGFDWDVYMNELEFE